LAAIAENERAKERAPYRLLLPVLAVIEIAWLAFVAYVVVRLVT
jgi:hypothetical protein